MTGREYYLVCTACKQYCPATCFPGCGMGAMPTAHALWVFVGDHCECKPGSIQILSDDAEVDWGEYSHDRYNYEDQHEDQLLALLRDQSKRIKRLQAQVVRLKAKRQRK
jgi:hypothetical protein